MNAKKCSEVAESLNNSCLKSISYRNQLEQILQETKRDVKQVDWRHQVPRLLSEALDHIEVQRALEENIRISAHENLDRLPLGSDEAQQLGSLLCLVNDSLEQRLKLHGLLVQARSVFLDEQLRQCALYAD